MAKGPPKVPPSSPSEQSSGLFGRFKVPGAANGNGPGGNGPLSSNPVGNLMNRWGLGTQPEQNSRKESVQAKVISLPAAYIVLKVFTTYLSNFQCRLL